MFGGGEVLGRASWLYAAGEDEVGRGCGCVGRDDGVLFDLVYEEGEGMTVEPLLLTLLLMSLRSMVEESAA